MIIKKSELKVVAPDNIVLFKELVAAKKKNKWRFFN